MRPRLMYRLAPAIGRVSYFESLTNAVRRRQVMGGNIDTLERNVNPVRALWLRITGSDYKVPADYRVLRVEAE